MLHNGNVVHVISICMCTGTILKHLKIHETIIDILLLYNQLMFRIVFILLFLLLYSRCMS